MKKVLKNIPTMYSCTRQKLSFQDYVDEINREIPYILIKVFYDEKEDYWRVTFGKSLNTMRDIQMICKGIEMCGYEVERCDFEI